MRSVLMSRQCGRASASLLLLLMVVLYFLLTPNLRLPFLENTLEPRGGQQIQEEINIILVICRSNSKNLLNSIDRQLLQASVAIKAAAYLSLQRIRFLIVSDSQDVFNELVALTQAWPTAYKERISFKFLASWYPPEHEDMKGLFRPCSSQRLFLLRLLPEESAVLYMDSDVIFLRPPEELWQIFNEFDERQFAAAALDKRDYNYIPKEVRMTDMGFNAGLILMNLTRMRQFPGGWEDQVLNITATYSDHFQFGDQDILNIFFAKFKSHFYPLGCEWMGRAFYCERKKLRACPKMMNEGSKTVHGAGGSFYTRGKFKAFYKAWQELNMTQHVNEFQANLRKNLSTAQKDKHCVEHEYIDRILSQQLVPSENSSARYR